MSKAAKLHGPLTSSSIQVSRFGLEDTALDSRLGYSYNELALVE